MSIVIQMKAPFMQRVYGVKKSKLTHKAHSHQMTKRKPKEEG